MPVKLQVRCTQSCMAVPRARKSAAEKPAFTKCDIASYIERSLQILQG